MKYILFIDFDGTLCHDRFWRSLDPIAYEKVQTFLFEKNWELVNDWMRGKSSSEEISNLLATHLGMPREEVWEVFVKDCQTMMVSQEDLALIKKLHEKYTTILITSNMDSFERFTLSTLSLVNCFDEIINSYNEKKLKSDDDGKLFLEIASRHNADIKEATLIDNSKSTCTRFEKLGGKAYLATNEQTLNHHLETLLT